MVFHRQKDRDPRGQTLVEFALVLPILVLIVLGIMQFGLLFWAQITLTQAARDTGRWAATQTECDSTAITASVISEGQAIADQSVLMGYGGPGDPDLVVTPTWSPGGTDCPPVDNTTVQWVNVDMTYRVGVFIPFIADTCTPNCQRTLHTDVQFRMEPEPAP